RSGTDPYAPGTEPHARTTDPYAQALSKDTPSQGTDEVPTPPSQPFVFPPKVASLTPAEGPARARAPPRGLMLESSWRVVGAGAGSSDPRDAGACAHAVWRQPGGGAQRGAPPRRIRGAAGPLPVTQHRGGGEQARRTHPAAARSGDRRGRGRPLEAGERHAGR